MKNIQIGENLSPVSNEKIILYKRIFGETPWDEGFICKNCGKIYNIKFMGICSCFKSNLKPFYKNSEVKKTFTQLSKNLGYKELIAKLLEKEVGFICGWQTSLDQLNDDKLGLTEEQLKLFIRKVNDSFPEFDFTNFYYLAEIGVKNECRGQDIAGNLYRKNLKQIKNDGVSYILVRTTKKTDVPYKWFLKEGYQDIFSYLDEQDRVILILKI